MKLLQGISRSMRNLSGSPSAEDYTRIGAALVEIKEKIREDLQAATADNMQRILKKLADFEPLNSQDRELVGFWVVGDAAGYTKVENDFPHWLAEFRHLGDSLEGYEGREDSPDNLVEAHGLLEDAIRVAADITNYLEKKERVERFSQAIHNMDRDDANLLGDILRSMLTRPDL